MICWRSITTALAWTAAWMVAISHALSSVIESGPKTYNQTKVKIKWYFEILWLTIQLTKAVQVHLLIYITRVWCQISKQPKRKQPVASKLYFIYYIYIWIYAFAYKYECMCICLRVFMLRTASLFDVNVCLQRLHSSPCATKRPN